MNYSTIEFEKKDRIGYLWLNRPEVHNAFNNIMIMELGDFFQRVNDEEVVALVIRGKGKSFCAGADLKWMSGVAKNTYGENFAESRQLADCFYHLYKCKKPTIAVVHGAALGGANGLLATCDLAYCDDSTTFSLSEVKIGIIPACISPYVIKRIGEYAARDLMLSGRRIKGKEAEHLRLVNKSLPADELEDFLEISLDVLRTSGPKAMEHCKRLIYDVSNELKFDEMHDYTAKMIADIRASEEGQEGMAAFLEKRKPNWIANS